MVAFDKYDVQDSFTKAITDMKAAEMEKRKKEAEKNNGGE